MLCTAFIFRLLCLALLGWLSISAARAQDEACRPFYTADTLRRNQLAVAQQNALRAEIPVPKTGSGEYREYYRRVVQEASADVYNAIRYAALLDPVVEPFVQQQVFARILRANPQLPAGAGLVLTRNPEPNARAVDRNTVLLNLGLLPRLENESQLAHVLCHELAHGASHHLETGLRDRPTTIYSKELRREFRRIVNSEYNISSQLKALALGFSLSSSYHHRRFERQADSLGFVLLARTAYEAPQAFRTLQLLDVLSRRELVQSWFDFDFDCYDHALFEALQLLARQPQSGYLPWCSSAYSSCASTCVHV